MVVYNFMVEFVGPITSGLKNHTIRGARKRHARPGEPIQLQHGSRFRPVRFGVSTCRYVHPIELDFTPGNHCIATDGSAHPVLEALLSNGRDHFAQSDGFESWDQMAAFWQRVHDTTSFAGFIIGWVPLPEISL